MPADIKWRVISRRANQPVANVLSVYVFLLVNASANDTERGRTRNFNAEDVAGALDLEVEAVEEILRAMQGKVLDKDHLTGWEKRQPKREDNSAERSRKWREQQNERVANAYRTQQNAQIREEKIREEKNNKPLSVGADAPTEKSAPAEPSEDPKAWAVEVDRVAAEAAQLILSQHPSARRDIGNKKAEAHVIAILKRRKLYTKSKSKEATDFVAKLCDRHRRFCETEQWHKDGGEYAKGLNNWLGSPKEFYAEEPPAAGPTVTSKPEPKTKKKEDFY